jgi:hypothetical protein
VAFTLIEVMIAMFIFFIVVFAVLGVVIQSMGAARALQVTRPNSGMLAAEFSLTNCLEEGLESGDFGELFPESTWERKVTPVASNQLWLVEFAVIQVNKKGKSVEEMQVLMFRPECSAAGVRR